MLRNTLNILVVDEVGTGFELLSCLVKNSKISALLDRAATVKEARSLLADKDYDLCFMGYAKERTAMLLDILEMPVIVFASDDDKQASLEALSAGATYFIPQTQMSIETVELSIAGAVTTAAKIKKLQQEALFDPLTGLHRSSAFKRRLEQEIVIAEKMRTPLTLCICDLNDFKGLNDTYGHVAGDEILMQVASTLQESIRGGDVAARFGGDEFCILFPRTTLLEAERSVARIKAALAMSPVIKGSDLITVSAAFGLAEFKEGMSVAALIDAADKKMYAIKPQRERLRRLPPSFSLAPQA